jgi:hypothetical protein
MDCRRHVTAQLLPKPLGANSVPNAIGANLDDANLKATTVDDAQLERSVGTPAVMPDGMKTEVEE